MSGFIVLCMVVLITATSVSEGLFVSWDKNANLTKDDIFIKRIHVPNKFNGLTQAFRNLTSHTLDERCHKGMALSISWSLNEPYSGVLGPIRVGRKNGFAARGIFPSKSSSCRMSNYTGDELNCNFSRSKRVLNSTVR